MPEDVTWGDNPIRKVDLTKKEYETLLNNIKFRGMERQKEQGKKKFRECDFIAGALTVMERFGIQNVGWVMKMLSGRSIINEK